MKTFWGDMHLKSDITNQQGNQVVVVQSSYTHVYWILNYRTVLSLPRWTIGSMICKIVVDNEVTTTIISILCRNTNIEITMALEQG